MAFDGNHSVLAASAFPIYQPLASVKLGAGHNGSKWKSRVSLEEQDIASYVPWSHNTNDDPYDLISCAQSNAKTRRPTDYTDSDVETDLQSLVSNILDEAESQNSYSGRGLPTCDPMWFPKTLGDELLQYFQSDDKIKHNSIGPQNFASCETSNKALEQPVDINVQPKEHASSRQWTFSMPNREGEAYTLGPRKLPPGLPVPDIRNNYLSQMQQNKHDSTSRDENRGNGQHMNSFPDLNHLFSPQIETTSPFLHSYYDHFIQNSTEPISNKQYAPQNRKQLAIGFQSLLHGEQDDSCHREFPDMYRERVGKYNEDRMLELWKFTSPAMSTQSAPAIPTRKDMMGEFGTALVERNGALRNEIKCDAFQELHGFNPQNTEFVQQPKVLSGCFSFPNQYQNMMTMQRKNTALPINMNSNQYLNHHLQQDQIQSKIKPQMLKEKKRMNKSGFLGQNLSSSHITNSMVEGDNKQQKFDSFKIMQSKEFDGEYGMVSTKNTHQFMPVMYPVYDPRRHCNTNSSDFNSRSTLPYCCPGMDKGDMMSANELAAFKAFVSNPMSRREESPYHGLNSAMTSPLVMNEEHVTQLYFYLDECFDQWKCLEKERKKTEVIIAKTFGDKSTAATTSSFQPKTPRNPTRIDHLIVNQMREQARVASLLDQMESLNNFILNINIHAALKRHYTAVCITEEKRKEEITNMSKHQQQKTYFTEYRDTVMMVMALKDLAATTRRLRTALWCALQMTLPKPVKREDQAKDSTRCPSPFKGYSFKL